MTKLLLNLAVIDRPKTTERCIRQLIKCSKNSRNKFIWVVQDQNSNAETKEVLYRYTKEFDYYHEWDWNVGCAFEINYAMSLAEEDFIDVNSDWHLYSDDWYDIMKEISLDEDVGVVAGRRADFWIDRAEKTSMFKSGIVRVEKRHGHWCELVDNSLILGPFWWITKKVIDKVGYMNEANGIDDVDYYHRVHLTGLKSLYVPDILARQPQDEEQHHPQYGSHKALLARTASLQQKYMLKYLKKQIYWGTRFRPETMTDEEYKKESDFNWEWLRKWPNVGEGTPN